MKISKLMGIKNVEIYAFCWQKARTIIIIVRGKK